VAVMQG